MKFTNLLLVSVLLLALSCKTPTDVYKIEGKNVNITDSIQADARIETFIKPYREHINKDLDSILGYSVDTYSKSDGHLNTAIGNLMADVVYQEADPVFFKRTGAHIDFVLLNHGGIRSIISKGAITKRTAFEVMPFENSIVVSKLPGAQVQELLDYLARAKRAHPISKLKILLDRESNVIESAVDGVAIDFNKTYYIATNDYLINGGDGMDFFKSSEEVIVLDYKIRNALVDYFMKTDTLNPVADDRFIQLKD
ncbi:5'-nucleotidase C-terminal domain-containing protein [Gelidibacter salicanalis]|uniref:5'-nucleotidase C-terminal domain-containing protein n=1 Tax=Gelidibacter salicanalis TaxID=291193 RepID=A0A934NIW7_9FLAO|nr:5'-nucleotidase [Gelidibacter salicanalis]MBJ7881698.1 5'-nucleotidase C-terminal domain-containing protein [Gelidibacter salicanalis]